MGVALLGVGIGTLSLAERYLPSGIAALLVAGIALGIAGFILIAVLLAAGGYAWALNRRSWPLWLLAVNWLAAALLLGSILFYTHVYTVWLKRRSWTNIMVGGLAEQVNRRHRLDIKAEFLCGSDAALERGVDCVAQQGAGILACNFVVEPDGIEPIAGGRHKVFGHPDLADIATLQIGRASCRERVSSPV